jgi:hypothetical protein
MNAFQINDLICGSGLFPGTLVYLVYLVIIHQPDNECKQQEYENDNCCVYPVFSLLPHLPLIFQAGVKLSQPISHSKFEALQRVSLCVTKCYSRRLRTLY